MTSEPICIRRTATVEEADIVIAWLADRGVEAMVLDRSNPGVMAFGVTDVEGIAIGVADQETADRAKGLLDEHDREKREGGEPTAETGPSLTCEECGKPVDADRGAGGTTLECPHCGAYVDVPESPSP